jgi:3',5'-cyclic AMP phosphodiesterase CpdA
MKIAHFSDPHISALPDSFGAVFDKRILGTANYLLRRRFLHDESMLVAAVDFILANPPDAVVCTGDITSTGSPREFRAAMAILNPLTKLRDTRFVYVPGNHDAYVRDKRCANALADAFAELNGGGFSLGDLPVKIAVGDCELILINEGRPTNPFMSSGTVDRAAAEKIEGMLEDKKSGVPAILVGHLPLLTNKKPLGFRRELRGGGREILERLLRTGRIDLSLCGHEHVHRADIDETGRGEIRAGAITRTGDVNLIEYDSGKDSFSLRPVDVRYDAKRTFNA